MNTSIFDKSAVKSAPAPRFVTPASFALNSIALLLSAVALRPATLLRSVLALRPATLLRSVLALRPATLLRASAH